MVESADEVKLEADYICRVYDYMDIHEDWSDLEIARKILSETMRNKEYPWLRTELKLKYSATDWEFILIGVSGNRYSKTGQIMTYASHLPCFFKKEKDG